MTLALTQTIRAPRRGLAGIVDRVLKLAWVGLGLVIMAAGIVISPLPGPMGLPVFVVGLVLVLRASWWAKRVFIRMQQARPNWVFPVRRLLRKKPEFAPVFWQQVLRVERRLLKRGRRFLARRRRMARTTAARRA